MSTVLGVRTVRRVRGICAGRAALVLAMLGAATVASAQAAAPVTFNGLTHTAVGDATLRLDTSRDTLEVHTTNADGSDGVAVALDPRTTSWTAEHVASARSGLPLAMTWTAHADGRAISRARLTQNGDRFALSARFSGATDNTSTYAIHVYDNGRLVGAVGGVPPTAHILIPISWCQFTGFFDCGFVSNFHNTPDQQCGWKFTLPAKAPMPIELPNGVRLAGNEILLLEEVRPAGHYPYLSFDGLTMRTNADLLTLISERVR